MQTQEAPSRSERSRQILATLAKHGLAAGAELAFHGASQSAHSNAVEARLACEELGTTFIKLGQILSARADLLPTDYRDELAKLQDDVPPVETAAIQDEFAAELGERPQDVFARFDLAPAASASIGQVHAATLPDGRDVVVKIQKPGVRELVERDLDILGGLARSAEKHFPHLQEYDLQGLLEEFANTLRSELDYAREARNIERFASLFSSEDGFWLPEVIPEFSTTHVLTMTRVDGFHVDDSPMLTSRRRAAASQRVARFVLEPALTEGYFYADPHPGNVLVRKDGTIAVLDFGMVGHLSEDLRRGVADMFLAMQRSDATRLVDRLIQLAPPARPVDRPILTQRMERLLERYLGDSLEQMDIATALHEILELIREHGLRSPASLALLFKAVAIADGMVLAITPETPLTHFLEPIAKRVTSAKLAPAAWARRARTSAMEAAELSVELPRHADRVLADLERGNLRVWARIEDLDPMLTRFEHMVERANATMIAAACVVGITVLFAVYRPAGWQVAAGWVFWIALAIAIAVGARTALAAMHHKHYSRRR